MVVAYVFDGELLYQVKREDERLTCNRVDFPLHNAVTVACFSPGEFYFINRGLPNVLLHMNTSFSCVEHALSGPVHHLFVHRQKVYGCGNDCLYAFDPLSADIETINLEHKVLEAEAADHGFVFVDDSSQLYAFHFNQGVRRVESVNEPARLLGRHNRHVVALLDSGKVISVNENGQIREDIFSLAITTRFISLDGNRVLTSMRNGELSLYTPEATLVSLGHFEGKDLRFVLVPSAEAEDSCSICFCDFKEGGGGVTLDCGHRFHSECIAEFSRRADSFVEKGEHIVFTYAVCPCGCGYHIRHASAPLSAYMGALHLIVTKDAELRLRIMPDKSFEDLLYYVCFRCGIPFYGGERKCFRSMSGEPKKKPSELLCSNCNDDFVCPNHKHEFVLYKCRYCCSPATHLSFGNRYLCDRCNSRWESTEPEPITCLGSGSCPLVGTHCANGSYPLGCMLCTPLETICSNIFSTP